MNILSVQKKIKYTNLAPRLLKRTSALHILTPTPPLAPSLRTNLIFPNTSGSMLFTRPGLPSSVGKSKVPFLCALPHTAPFDFNLFSKPAQGSRSWPTDPKALYFTIALTTGLGSWGFLVTLGAGGSLAHPQDSSQDQLAFMSTDHVPGTVF